MKHRPKYPSWRRRHEGVLTYLAEHPWATLKQCAEATGYTASQVSRITCSPEFKRRHSAYMDARFAETVRRQFSRPKPD